MLKLYHLIFNDKYYIIAPQNKGKKVNALDIIIDFLGFLIPYFKVYF